MGHDFLRIRGVKYLTYGPMGKSQCRWEDPSKCQLPFLSFSPIIYFCQNVVELVIAWKGKSMGNQIRIGQRPIFEKRVLTSLARKIPKNVGLSSRHPRFSFSCPFSFTLGVFWQQLEFFLCVWIPRFGCWLHFSHGWEVVLIVLGIGLSSSRFWSC